MKRSLYFSIAIALLVIMLPAAVIAAPPGPGKPVKPEKTGVETSQPIREPLVESELLAEPTDAVDVLLVASDDDTRTWSSPVWSRVTSGGNPTISPHNGSGMAKFNSYDTYGAARLLTPNIDLSSTSAPQVSFWMSHDYGLQTFPDNIQIQISTDGTNWTDVGEPIMRVDPSCSTACWQQHTVTLPDSFRVSGVYLGFLGDSWYGNNIFLDTIAVMDGATAILEEGFEEDAVLPTGWSQEGAPWAGGFLERALVDYGDLGAVDRFNAWTGTPTISELQAYDVVLTWSNYTYNDPTALGNTLADYVDSGGKVINLIFSMDSVAGWALAGRFIDENYVPMWGSEDHITSACLGTYDDSHPIMEGITGICDSFYIYNGLELTEGSNEVARWDNDELFVAAKEDRSVVSINAYVGLYRETTGDIDALVHNAILWLVSADQFTLIFPLIYK